MRQVYLAIQTEFHMKLSFAECHSLERDHCLCSFHLDDLSGILHLMVNIIQVGWNTEQ